MFQDAVLVAAATRAGVEWGIDFEKERVGRKYAGQGLAGGWGRQRPDHNAVQAKITPDSLSHTRNCR